jgi:hypothetical protein
VNRSNFNKVDIHEKKQAQTRQKPWIQKNRKTEPTLTLYPRMVNSEANPVSIPIKWCQIVHVKVHRHCPRVVVPRTFSTQQHVFRIFLH